MRTHRFAACGSPRARAPRSSPQRNRPLGKRGPPARLPLASLAALTLLLGACDDQIPTAPFLDASPRVTPVDTEAPAVRAVGDLEVTGATASTLEASWTEVNDGVGRPASYRVEYAEDEGEWRAALDGCGPVLEGHAIGAPMSCTIEELRASTSYAVRVISFRPEGDEPEDAAYSPVTLARTGDTEAPPPARRQGGIWIDAEELAALPTSGPAWENLRAQARGSCGRPRLNDQEQQNNVCVMAKALVYARTNDAHLLDDVLEALRAVADLERYQGRALALGRELPAYVIAADLVDLAAADPGLDRDFRSRVRRLLTEPTHSGPSNLVDCHERRPNNWGTHCGAARIAVAAYLGDEDELERAARVFKGWVGDRAAYAGFSYGDLSWQCDPSHPVGINPRDCQRHGHTLDGVIADDQRRGGRYSWPAPRENYVWEALQGALAQAVLLDRAGYPAFEWEDRALLRAVSWLYEYADYPADGDDTWQPYVVNHYYGTDFRAPARSLPGKNVGWTDWTHG